MHGVSALISNTPEIKTGVFGIYSEMSKFK